MSRGNVAIFVPHNGCPHQCSFCDQRQITGQQKQPTPEEVWELAKKAAKIQDVSQCELAFFGGSFTAIDREYFCSLLAVAKRAREELGFSGVRCSTRPDAIDEERLELLKEHGFTTIELGAQCMDDGVLLQNGRGHTVQDVENASHLVKTYNFTLGLQMMTGLPGSNDAIDTVTANTFTAINPDFVRIYPTLVLPGTRLAQWYQEGSYQPQTLCKAVELCSDLLLIFQKNKIPVIRLGLHDTPELQQQVLAGPYHPAFRQLCESRIFLREILSLLGEKCRNCEDEIILAVHPKSISNALGQKRGNLTELQKRGWRVRFMQDASVLPGQIEIQDSILSTKGKGEKPCC